MGKLGYSGELLVAVCPYYVGIPSGEVGALLKLPLVYLHSCFFMFRVIALRVSVK